VVWGATRAGGDDGGAVAREAGDAVDAGGLDRFGQGRGGRMLVTQRISVDALAAGGLIRRWQWHAGMR
jgi:hypothetical protein